MSAQLDKKARRKSRREARKAGVYCPDLALAQRIATSRECKVGALNQIIFGKGVTQADKQGARKARKELNTVWIKSGREKYCDARQTPKAVKDAVLHTLSQAQEAR